MKIVEKKNTTKCIKVFIRCMQVLYKHSKLYLPITFLVSIVRGIFPIISLLIMQRIINSLQAGSYSLYYYTSLIVIYAILDLLDNMLNTFYSLYNTKFTYAFDRKIKSMLLDKAKKLELRDFENRDTYDIINRAKVQSGIDILKFYNIFIGIITTLVKVFSSILILSRFNLMIIPIALFFPTCKYLYSLKISKTQYNIQMERTSGERKLWYIEFLLLTGNAFKEIKLYQIGDMLIEQYNKRKVKYDTQDIKIIKKGTIIQFILNGGDIILSNMLFGYLIFRGIYSYILIGDVVTYSRCIFSIKSDMEMVFTSIEEGIKKSLYINLLFEFFDLPTTEISGEIEIEQIESIELKDVSFVYSFASKSTLRNINLRLDKNKIIGIVGKNGMGKSTLLKLIMGYYNDYKGSILVNGIDIKKINIETYRKRLGCVFQDFVRYEASLGENVGYGNLKYIEDYQLIQSKLEFAGFDMEVVDYELKTILGNWFGKKQLSTGEWQKVAIARAAMREADVYVFDEPDSALDVLAKEYMLEEYKKLLQGKMGIFISHKIEQVSKLANEIIVIENGEIKEQGTHQELLEKRGVYFELYRGGDVLEESV